VPDDLSVIGFDDIHISEVTIPPLTTVQMSRFELARAAVTALRAHVEPSESAEPKREYDIQTELIVRESTGIPRDAVAHPSKPRTTNNGVHADEDLVKIEKDKRT
jgi:LacI family transcriptional regulator